MQGFINFLKEYSVIGLAIAVIMGAKINELVKAVVDQLVMPLIGLIFSGDSLKAWVIPVGDTQLGVGIVVGALINFTIVAAVVYAIAKFILKEAEVKKR